MNNSARDQHHEIQKLKTTRETLHTKVRTLEEENKFLANKMLIRQPPPLMVQQLERLQRVCVSLFHFISSFTLYSFLFTYNRRSCAKCEIQCMC